MDTRTNITVEFTSYSLADEVQTYTDVWDITEDELTGLLLHWEASAKCDAHNPPVPCRLEFHDLPDGSQLVCRFDCNGDLWETAQITR